jgi:hypothetical protein
LEVEAGVVREHTQGGPDEPGHAIGMGAGAAALHQVAEGGDVGDALAPCPRLDDQGLHGAGQGIEAVDAGAALAGTLALEVPDHPAHLEEWADATGEEDDHPRAD